MQHQPELPTTSGIGLKPQHYQSILEEQPAIGWFECHPENYMGDGGLPHYYLSQIKERYPLSMHGVGLSLGSADGIDNAHLLKLKKVVTRYQPEQVSEHLAWSHWNATFLNDLLPLPYTETFLNIVEKNILQVQDVLQRSILIENPSVYLGFHSSDLSETDFLRELVKRTECGLLLDVNNVYVSAHNLDYSSYDYINHYPLEAVKEIHLAGHATNTVEKTTVLIDDHGSSVKDAVWALYRYTIEKMNRPTATLIEWDTDVPELPVLLQEAQKAQKIMDHTLTGSHHEP